MCTFKSAINNIGLVKYLLYTLILSENVRHFLWKFFLQHFLLFVICSYSVLRPIQQNTRRYVLSNSEIKPEKISISQLWTKTKEIFYSVFTLEVNERLLRYWRIRIREVWSRRHNLNQTWSPQPFLLCLTSGKDSLKFLFLGELLTRFHNLK